MLKVTFFYRKKYPSAFSIEQLFKGIEQQLSHNKSNIEIGNYELAYYNNKLKNVLKNIFQAKNHEGNINHITGDVYSIIFGFRHPTIITIHDCNPLLRYSKWHPRYWFYRWIIYEWPIQKAQAITVISNKTKQELSDLVSIDLKKIHVIPNYLNPEFKFTPFKFNHKNPRILQVGVKKNKNIKRLAIALNGIQCHLDIIGKPDDSDIYELNKNKISFSFETQLTSLEVIEKYKNCDLVVFASTYEGFGLPILEAQAIGRPVITSNISPMKEVAGKGAVLVDPYKSESIRLGIKEICMNENLRNQLIMDGCENIKNYSIVKITQKFHNLYSSIATE